jgi:hypothetical protein
MAKLWRLSAIFQNKCGRVTDVTKPPNITHTNEHVDFPALNEISIKVL